MRPRWNTSSMVQVSNQQTLGKADSAAPIASVSASLPVSFVVGSRAYVSDP